jgi:CheY-like chemotaxis protein
MARVLIVDDEPHVIALYGAILEAAGHTPELSLAAEEAIVRLVHHTYDAVITGWRLDGGTGAAVITAAKARGFPVIVVSSYVAEAFQEGSSTADLYLEKPITPEELITAVNDFARKTYRSAAG